MPNAPTPLQRPGVTVVVPTVGRPSLLRNCLDSLARCEPPPTEVIVVDQSCGPGTAAVVDEQVAGTVRLIQDDGVGAARAMNLGISASRTEHVLITHDDCTVSRDWVGAALAAMFTSPNGIISGRVLPSGDLRLVPTFITCTQPRDFTGTISRGVLYPLNMAGFRKPLLDVGGFDERVLLAEDNDLCYRWLRQGRPLRYEPAMTVWHHDWRSPQQLRRHYRGYARGEGIFYAKHLCNGDLTVLRYLGADIRDGVVGIAAAVLRRELRWWDWRLSVFVGLPGGLIRGWRIFGSERRNRV